MKVVAFVPIKLSNQRLPGKNVMPLNGKPVCSYLFDTLAAAEGFDEKYVFCSDEAIIPYIPEGLSFLKREKWLDGNQVKGLEIIGNFIENIDADIYCITHVTSPFTKVSSYESSLGKILHEGYDSAFTAERIQTYCWYDGAPVNYDLCDIVTTQNIKPIYAEKSCFYMFRKEVFTKYHRRIGLNPFIQEVDAFEGVDIDTKEDFEFAQAVAGYLNRKDS